MKKQEFTVKDRPAFLIQPERRPSNVVTPWVWYAPLLPGLPDGAEDWMFERFLDAGIAVTAVDVGESCGNPAGRAIYSALHEELTARRGFSKKACLLPRSRGGLMLYNWAIEHTDSVACIAGIYPVCDMRTYPGLKLACGAYDLTEEELAAQLTVHNPVNRLEGLAKARVPIFHIHGDVDVGVPFEANTVEVKRRYERFGGEMTVVVAKGQGHNMWPGFFQCQELVDFVIAHARSVQPAQG